MDFPTLSILPVVPLDTSSELKTLRSQSEDGYVITRAQWTRAKRTFTINYALLPNDDITTLQTFFETQAKGGSEVFNWTHPVTGTIYQVRFAEDKLEISRVHYNYSNVTFKLEEV